MKSITFNKEAQMNLPNEIKQKMEEDRELAELEKEVKVKLLKVCLNKSNLNYAKNALNYIEELEQKLNMRIVGKSFNASLKVGDKVLKAGVFDAQIIEELKPNVFKIKYPDGYEMLARTQDLVLATESI
tara:strand:+ start:1410 stop:1796 length:387 start_codon:yes stop_codon:yes gene_type:complete